VYYEGRSLRVALRTAIKTRKWRAIRNKYTERVWRAARVINKTIARFQACIEQA
jgi:hypothetical protein